MIRKVFFIIATLLICSFTSLSQSENNKKVQKKMESVLEYSKDKEGIFYVIIPVDEVLAEGTKEEIKTFNVQNGFSTLRMTSFWIDNQKTERTWVITLRRFDNEREAIEYIKLIKETYNYKVIKYNAVQISLNNYRTFLKRRDLNEYINFIDN